MDNEYRATYEYLFDKEENLFYRDWHYFGKKEANGKKVFWGRGNAWVLAGLAEVLQELPKGLMERGYAHVSPDCRTKTVIGMPAFWIRLLILLPKPVPPVSLYMRWPMA